jgi:hypothetical protein
MMTLFDTETRDRISYAPQPMIFEFQPLADKAEFINQVNEKKKIFVSVKNETKTILTVSLYSSPYRFAVNWKVDGIKTVERDRHSFFTNRTDKVHHFKVLKNQRLPQLEKYITEICNILFNEDVDIVIFSNQTIFNIT